MPNVMNVSVSYIRRALQESYSVQEAANLSRIVCCEMLGQTTIDYYLGKDIILSSKEMQKLNGILARLLNFEPIQYIQGTARFLENVLMFRAVLLLWDYHVAPGVLIPRPETEELVEVMLREIPSDARILDIGTGSGCIAISLSKTFPNAKVTAWDVSEDALCIARRNNDDLQASVCFVKQDVLAWRGDGGQCYDVIVSNPPYITESEKQEMERNVLDWEPFSALFVPNNDPLLFYRRIGELGRMMLVDGGRLYFEINRAYGEATAMMLCGQGYTGIRILKDISGNDRFVIAER